MDVKWHIPSTCLDASRKWFSTGISSINRTFKWLCLKTRQTPQNGQNVHSFQVRTPICHIVPVSRAYPPPRIRVKWAPFVRQIPFHAPTTPTPKIYRIWRPLCQFSLENLGKRPQTLQFSKSAFRQEIPQEINLVDFEGVGVGAKSGVSSV